MAIKDDIREFLTTRRARVTPDQVGLATLGNQRRVPGLRCEEVAMLAGVSTDYYIRLERGNLAGVSEQVLEALSRALLLDDAERTHLADLARASAGPVRRAPRSGVSRVRPGVLRLLEALNTPAYVRNARMDILAANDAAVALYGGVLDHERLPVNVARLVFLDENSPDFFLDWDDVADMTVAALRIQAGHNPHDKHLTELVGALATRSDAFRTRWARHNVRHHRTTAKRLHSPLVGDLDVVGEAMELSGDGLTIITYTAEPDSTAAEALRFLASWASRRAPDGAGPSPTP